MRRSLLAAAFAVQSARLFAGPEPGPQPDRSPERVELASPEVVAPLQMVRSRPVVDVTIDGKGPFPFVLDTGAAGTVLGADLVKELELPVVGQVRIGDPINPRAIAAKQVRIDRLAVGGATFSGMVATSMENSGFQEHLGARGVLGMPVFAELLLTLDFGRSEVRVGRGELPVPDGKQVISYHAGHGGTIRVPITVGSIALAADLDSGSPRGLSLPSAYMDELPLEGKPVEVGRARTVNSEFVVYGATLKGAVKIGGHSVESPALHFNALPAANLGNEVLGRFTITIDQTNRRIRFAVGELVGGPSPDPRVCPESTAPRRL
ncbi:MAG: retropepsin-like aspartic protease [Thermoanaerobaculia bacterium]